MISIELLLYCILVGAVYLFLMSLLLEFIGKRINAFRGIPRELAESSGSFWFALNLTMELILYVVIPSIAYSYFYILLPLSGVRTAVAGGLFAFTLGAVPALLSLLNRTRLPILMFAYLLLTMLLKLTGSLLIIGYLYQL
jgi:hypothetical protein